MIDSNDQPLSSNICIVLLDNGSLKAETTLRLRSLALNLSSRLGVKVWPVSVRHSNKVDPSELGGEPGVIWCSFLDGMLKRGARRFVVVPLFFGQSGALTDYVPTVIRKRDKVFAEAEFVFAKPLVDLDDPDDCALAQIVSKLIAKKLNAVGDSRISKIFVIDHGSPIRRVTECRDLVASQVSEILFSRDEAILPCSMERRDGDEYSFSDPLLSDLLNESPSAGNREILLSRMFLFPGRHACPGGDIDAIISDSQWIKDGGVVYQTDLLGEDSDLVSLLERRFREVEPGFLLLD